MTIGVLALQGDFGLHPQGARAHRGPDSSLGAHAASSSMMWRA